MQLVLKYTECLLKGGHTHQPKLKRLVSVVISRSASEDICLESVLQLG